MAQQTCFLEQLLNSSMEDGGDWKINKTVTVFQVKDNEDPY